MSRAPWRPSWWRDAEVVALVVVSVAVVGMLLLYTGYVIAECDCDG